MLRVNGSVNTLSHVAIGAVVRIEDVEGSFIVLGYDDSWKLWECFNLETKVYSYFDDFRCWEYKVING